MAKICLKGKESIGSNGDCFHRPSKPFWSGRLSDDAMEARCYEGDLIFSYSALGLYAIERKDSGRTNIKDQGSVLWPTRILMCRLPRSWFDTLGRGGVRLNSSIERSVREVERRFASPLLVIITCLN